MKTRSIFGCLLAFGFVLVNCTEAPPPPPPGENPPIERQTPTDPTTPPPAKLTSAGQIALPREVHALFVDGDTSYACTPEGALYKVKVKDMRRFQLSAVDLATQKLKWSYKGSSCVVRSSGDHLFVVRDLTEEPGKITIDRLNAKTGKVEGSIKATHNGCTEQEKSGPGERMFATSSGRMYSCFDMTVQSGKLLLTNENSVQLFDAMSGKKLWSYQVDKTEARVVGATVQGDMAYVMEGAQELIDGAVAPPAAQDLSGDKGLRYQLRAIAISGNETKWAMGPFAGPVLQARLSTHNGALVAQVLSSSSTKEASVDEILKVYGNDTWKGTVRTYSLDAASGKSHWQVPHIQSFNKGLRASTSKEDTAADLQTPIPTLHAPLAMQDGYIVQVPGTISMVSASQGSALWGIRTQDAVMSQIMAIASDHVHVRTSDGKSTLMKLIPKQAPELTRGDELGSLLYAADGIAPGADPSREASKKTPKRRFRVQGFCLRVSGGQPVPLSEVSNSPGGGIFLPAPSSYGSPQAFVNAFCARFLIDVYANTFDGKQIWKSQAYVPEAPIFFFVRNNVLFTLSDNGDWYQFKLQ